jgi:DNA-binding IclR family transcriptional regulator
MAENERYVIHILDVTLDAIEAMASGDNEHHSLSNLANQLKINRSRLFRILKTLERRGYVEYDPRTENYRLGVKLLNIGQTVWEHLNLRREAEELLKKLAIETGDCVHLIRLSGTHAIVLDRYLGGNMLQVAAPIGELLPLHTGAAPKLLLAFLPYEEREKILDEIDLQAYTSNTIVDKKELRKVLDHIRQVGYSVDAQDFEIGVYAFGAPIFDISGQIIAGISITTPTVRYNRDRMECLIERISSTAKEISKRLGYLPEQTAKNHQAQHPETVVDRQFNLQGGK